MLVSSLPQASAAAPAAAVESAAEAATSAALATKAVAVPDLFASVAVLENQPVEKTLFLFGP